MVQYRAIPTVVHQ